MADPGYDHEPVPPREAFDEDTPNSRRTQAALLLSVGAGVAEQAEHVPQDDEEFPLPRFEPIAHAAPIEVEQACRKLDLGLSADDYVRAADVRVSSDQAAQLTRELYDAPDVDTAAALVEAGMHSRYRLVRTAGAIAALGTTGQREDVIRVLEESAQSDDAEIRELARTGLARAVPDHPLLNRYVRRPRRGAARDEPSNTAVVSHGTWAANGRWWRTGGEFYEYLKGITPSLHVHPESFAWSGGYSHAERSLAADELIDWMSDQQLDRPDYIAHSHGITVANLATQRGLELDRVVMMAYPVHAVPNNWLPDIQKVNKIVDVRVRFDLVIIADGGGQRLPANWRNHPKVTEARNGWFNHSAPHDRDYWERHGIPALL